MTYLFRVSGGFERGNEVKQVSGGLLTQCAIEQYEQVKHLLTAVFQLRTSDVTRLLSSVTEWTKA